jgi:hypothetical protein
MRVGWRSSRISSINLLPICRRADHHTEGTSLIQSIIADTIHLSRLASFGSRRCVLAYAGLKARHAAPILVQFASGE